MDIINLLKKKKVDDFVIITGSEDEDFLKLFTMLQDTQVLEELKEEKKRLVFVQESGDMFAMGHNEAGANHKKATTFVCEHFKDLLNDPEYHYYGHHALNSGIHIRVFQDFYRNISDNKGIAFSFFENYIRRLKRTTHFDIIITLAFPHDPLDAIGEKLEKPLRMHHFSIDNSKSIEDVAESLVKTKDVGKEILLITDVIYSGKTINDVLAKLQAKGFHINKIVSLTANKQDWGSDLKAEIKEKTEVLLMNELPWWGPNSPKGCLLCNLFGSPPPYGDTAIVERKKPMTKLTSYDFYDFLKQTNAVERNKKTLKRNNYNFFFETSKIFLSFATHISRILVKQYGEEMKEAGLIVCPVDNNCSSILFAMHMSKKLGNLSIIPVSRGDIDAWKTYQENNLDGYAEIAGKNILLIDDGINTGATKNNLTRLCIAAGAKNVIGICVFLNRLSIELVEHMRLEKEVLWYFYHWPCPPIKNLEVG